MHFPNLLKSITTFKEGFYSRKNEAQRNSNASEKLPRGVASENASRILIRTLISFLTLYNISHTKRKKKGVFLTVLSTLMEKHQDHWLNRQQKVETMKNVVKCQGVNWKGSMVSHTAILCYKLPTFKRKFLLTVFDYGDCSWCWYPKMNPHGQKLALFSYFSPLVSQLFWLWEKQLLISAAIEA